MQETSEPQDDPYNQPEQGEVWGHVGNLVDVEPYIKTDEGHDDKDEAQCTDPCDPVKEFPRYLICLDLFHGILP